MIVIMRDAIMPDCCNTCICSEGYGCGITGTVMTTKEMEFRPDWCPLETVEPCEDTISRQTAIEALGEKPLAWRDGEYELGLQNQWESDVEAIKELPSAQPELPSYVAEIEEEYQKAVNSPYIHKPLAKALYEVWKKHDMEDAERRTDE